MEVFNLTRKGDETYLRVDRLAPSQADVLLQKSVQYKGSGDWENR